MVLFGADEAAALVLAERLRGRVGDHRFRSGAERLTVSVGIASAPEDSIDPSELFRLADDALYAAKSRGRDRVVLASDVQQIGRAT